MFFFVVSNWLLAFGKPEWPTKVFVKPCYPFSAFHKLIPLYLNVLYNINVFTSNSSEYIIHTDM